MMILAVVAAAAAAVVVVVVAAAAAGSVGTSQVLCGGAGAGRGHSRACRAADAVAQREVRGVGGGICWREVCLVAMQCWG